MQESPICSHSPLADVPEVNLKRRNALGVMGTGLAVLWGSSLPASAFLWGSKPKVTVDVSRLPAEWVGRQGSNLKDYADFLGGLKLSRLTAQQVIEAHAKRHGSVWNTLPPKSMWKSLAPTLKVVDRVAAELGQPVKEIVSAYRCPIYNARCAGAKSGSWHKLNVAVDVSFQQRPSTVTSMARGLRGRGVFKGGVGGYSGFTHIDTRGQNIDW